MQPSRAASANNPAGQSIESVDKIIETTLVIAVFAKLFRAAKR
jgi:hypothetical protein